MPMFGLRRTGDVAHRAALERQIAESQARIQRYERQAASGRRLEAAADDPAGAARAVGLRLRLAAVAQWQENASQARSRLAATEAALGPVARVIADARVLALAGAGDTRPGESRAVLAGQVNGLLEELATLSAARDGADHLFSGEAFDLAPYEFARDAEGRITAAAPVAAAGGAVERLVGDGLRLSVNTGAADVFGVGAAGRTDVFGLLIDLRDALQADDGARVASLLPGLDAGEEQVLAEEAAAGALSQRLATISGQLDGAAVDLEAARAGVEDVDMAQTVLDLAAEEAALKAALATTARIQGLSLFDFIR